MFSYLFQSITSIVFEPLTVTLLLWCVLAFGFFRKRNKVLFWFFTGAVIFMLAWRLICHSVMVSSRYGAFLIYPALICCACFTFKCAPFFRWLFKKFKLEFPGRNAFCRFISAAVLIGITVGCLIKTFRIDPYAKAPIQAAQVYLKHRQGPGELYVERDNLNRITWYAKKKQSEAKSIYLSDNCPLLPTIRNIVEPLKNIPGEHYFLFPINKGETAPTLESMKLTPDYGSWEIAARLYTSKRKTGEFLVARLKPACPNIQKWTAPISPIPKGNLHPNGNFEHSLTPEQGKVRAEFFKKAQIKDYDDILTRQMPLLWSFAIAAWNAGNPPVIRLSDKNPLTGKYSLAIDARPPRSYALGDSWYRITKRCKYTLFVRGEGSTPSQVRIGARTWNPKLKKFRLEKRWEFLIEPGKVYRLQGTIPLDTFEKDWQNFNLQIGVRGYVTVDQLSLVPY